MKKIFFVLMIITIIFDGCKKFPDGPCISFRSVKKRIEGTWKVDKFYINGNDSTAEYNAKLGCAIEFINEFEMSYLQSGANMILFSCSNGKAYNGAWRYDSDNKDNFSMGFSKDSTMNNIGPFLSANGVNWIILRLTNKEFNLKTVDPGFWGSNPYGTIYIINLKKQ